MKRQRKPDITPEKLGSNKFLNHLVVKANKIAMAGQYKKDKDGVYLTVEVELESDEACRIYIDAAKRAKVAALSTRAKDLFLWLVYETEPGCEWIWINKPRYMAEHGIKAYNTYKEAIRELHAKDFVAATPIPSVYWINPDLFFNGSRIKAFPDKVVVK